MMQQGIQYFSNPKEAAQPIIRPKFPKNCMKIIGGGVLSDARPLSFQFYFHAAFGKNLAKYLFSLQNQRFVPPVWEFLDLPLKIGPLGAGGGGGARPKLCDADPPV